jgi:tetratricopeptide (TPR) repeat protein
VSSSPRAARPSLPHAGERARVASRSSGGATGVAARALAAVVVACTLGGRPVTAGAATPQSAAAPATPRSDAAAAAAQADAEIAFFAARVDRDPADFLTPTRLGNLLIRQARRTGEAESYARAEQALRVALDRNAGHVPAMAALVTVHLARHRFPVALAAARAAVEADGADPEARGVLGDALLETGDLAAAEAEYARVLDAVPSLFAYSRMANLLHARGDTPGAIAAFGKALERGEADGAPAEDRSWCLVQMGRLSFARGDWGAAEGHFNAALELVPGNRAATDHVAELRAAQARFDESVSLYESLVAAVPRPEWSQALGDVLVAAGRPEAARPWHDKALQAYLAAARAGDAHYFHHLAGFYADVAKDGTEAVKWARRDLALRRTVATLDALAWALHAAGEFAEAAATMDEALARPAGAAPDAHVLYHASLIYFKVGAAARAKDCLQRAAIANPKFRDFHVHR